MALEMVGVGMWFPFLVSCNVFIIVVHLEWEIKHWKSVKWENPMVKKMFPYRRVLFSNPIKGSSVLFLSADHECSKHSDSRTNPKQTKHTGTC